jgi:transcription elongation factor Elf1
MGPNNTKFVEPVAPVPDDDQTDHICPHCGADLFEVGVVEAISGGYSQTEIHFENGEKKTGITVIEDFDEQWALCGKCNERIECTAANVIEAFEALNPPKTAGGN